MKAEVVKIKADNKKGFAIIDKSAFDKTKHKLFTGKEEAPIKKFLSWFKAK